MTINQSIYHLDLHALLSSLIMLALGITIAAILHKFSFYMLYLLSKRYKPNVLKMVAERLRFPVLILSITLGLSFVVPLLSLPPTVIQFIEHLLSIIGIIGIAWTLQRVVTSIQSIILNHYDLTAQDNYQARKIHTQFKVVERIITTFVVILAIAAILMTFNKIRAIGLSLLAPASIAGVVLAFAAQKSLSVIFAGLQIAFTQPVRIDDSVIVEGEFGTIEEITLSYVVLKTWDKRRLIIPITYFLEKPFQNWTRTSADLIGTVMLSTDYTVPIEDLRNELQTILQQSPNWDGTANVLQVTEARENSVEIRILVSANNASKLWDLRCEVREKMINYLRQNYPNSLPKTRVVFKNEPELT